MSPSDDTLKADVYSAVQAVLENASLWSGVGFTVYRDFDMEAMREEPPRPYIFIGSRNTAVVPRLLPYIILDIEIDSIVVQMGSVSKRVRVTINIIGSVEGQASRISSVLKENVVTFGTGYIALQEQDRTGAYWTEQAVPVPEPAWSEGSLRQLLAINSEFIVL